MGFKEISLNDIDINFYELFDSRWPLLGGGTPELNNVMTISWGAIGSLWGHKGGKGTATVYVRDSRYTKKIIEENEYFTLSILPSSYKEELSYIGSHSGYDEDKIEKCNLHRVFSSETMYIEEAEYVLICKKLYKGHFNEEDFIDKNLLEEFYPTKDMHTVYIGDIVKVLKRE
ncbi:MAG: flavin reductase family protein [Coprobacillus sp.]|nr:flavin reductase family protein [Coprobacillus sp.]